MAHVVRQSLGFASSSSATAPRSRRRAASKRKQVTPKEDQSEKYFGEIRQEDNSRERYMKNRLAFERNKVIMRVHKRDLKIPKKKKTTEAANQILDDDSTRRQEEGYLTLLRKENPQVPNCCAICLEPYQKGDLVVWSSGNPDCQHAFHRKCITKYLITTQKKHGTSPCPCCRRSNFTNLKIEPKPTKTTALFSSVLPRRQSQRQQRTSASEPSAGFFLSRFAASLRRVGGVTPAPTNRQS